MLFRSFTICGKMLNKLETFKLGSFFRRIKCDPLSTEQYYQLINVVFSRFSSEKKYLHHFLLESIDIKKLGPKYYYDICKKAVLKSNHPFGQIKAKNLNREQYSELCFIVVKKSHPSIDEIDRRFINKKDWLELCKIAVKKKGTSLYYLDTLTPELLNLALRNGGGLKYVKKQTYTQCIAVVRKNGYELSHVRPGQFSNEQYFKLCKAAVETDAQALGSIDDMELTLKQYREICTMAIKSFHGTIRYIDQEKIPPRLYLSWCRKALKASSLWLDYFPFTDDYYDTCLKTVAKDKESIKYVKYLRLSPKQHAQIWKAAGDKGKPSYEKFLKGMEI